MKADAGNEQALIACKRFQANRKVLYGQTGARHNVEAEQKRQSKNGSRDTFPLL